MFAINIYLCFYVATELTNYLSIHVHEKKKKKKSVLLSDITTVWLANPFPYFASASHSLTDIMAYQDRHLNTYPYLSTSFLYLRPTPSTLSFWATFTQALELHSLRHIPAPRLFNLLLSYPLPVFHTIHHASFSSSVVASARDMFDTLAPTRSFPGEQSWPAIINNDWRGDLDTRQAKFAQHALWRVDDLEEGLCRPEMWFPEEDPEVWSLLQAVEELVYEEDTLSDLAASDDTSAALKPFVLHLHVLSTGNDPIKTQRFIDTLLSTTDGLPGHSRNWTVSLQFLIHPIPGVHSNQDASSRLSATLSSLISFAWPHGSKMVFMGNNHTSPDTYLMNPANVWKPQHGNEALLLTTDDVEWHDGWAEWLREVVETRWLCYRGEQADQLQEVEPACRYDNRAYGIALSVEDAGRQVLRFYGALEDRKPSSDALVQVQAWSPHAQIFFPYTWMRFTRFVEQMHNNEDDEILSGRFPLFPGTMMPEVEVVAAGNSEEDQVERWVRERRRISRLDAVDKMSVATARDDAGTWYTLFAAFVGRNGLHAFAPTVDLVNSMGGNTAMGLLTIDDPFTEVPEMDPHARATSKLDLDETVYDFQWRPTQPTDTPLQMREWAMKWVTWEEVQRRVRVVREWRLNPTKSSAKVKAVDGEEFEEYEVDTWWWTRFSTWVVMIACMAVVVVGFAVAWYCHGLTAEAIQYEKGDWEKMDQEKGETKLGKRQKV